jgi:AcrR family transcriptional regulator
MDRRIERTKHSLQDALLSLIRQQPYEDIEIQAIADRAGTARVTFYRHYATKAELLFDCLASIYDRIMAVMTPYELETVLDFRREPPCLALFEFLETDRELYRRLALGSMGALVQQRVRTYIVDENLRMFGQSARYADLPLGLIANHIASCVVGNVVWWLTDENAYSAEYIARMTHAMAITGALALVGRADEIVPPDEWAGERATA